MQALDSFGIAHAARLRAGPCNRAGGPVGLLFNDERFPAHANTRERAGEHLVNSAVDGMRRGNVIMAQHQCQRISIERRTPSRMSAKRFELRTEEQGVAKLSEVQR